MFKKFITQEQLEI